MTTTNLTRTAPARHADWPLFSGDWESDGPGEGWNVAFRPVGYDGDPSRGFASPVVTRDVMHAIVVRQEWLNIVSFNQTGETLTWEGDSVRVDYPGLEGEEPRWITPDEYNLYHLGVVGWCWYTLEPGSDVATVIG